MTDRERGKGEEGGRDVGEGGGGEFGDWVLGFCGLEETAWGCTRLRWERV